jgi:hypothetical protein
MLVERIPHSLSSRSSEILRALFHRSSKGTTMADNEKPNAYKSAPASISARTMKSVIDAIAELRTRFMAAQSVRCTSAEQRRRPRPK